MKNIIVPTDFSEYATNALEYAIKLADKMLANVHLVHVIEQPAYENFDTFADGYGDVGLDNVFILKLIEKSKKDLADLKMKYPKAELETHMKMTTSTTNEIVDYAIKLNADLIVMGSKGTNTLDEELIGSNTEKIVRSAHCPVLTIKEKTEFNIKDIVFASDFKDVNKTVLEQVKYYQNMFNANIHLLRVCTPHNFENTRILEGRMHELAVKHELNNFQLHTYNDFYEEDGIANFASHHNFDLICLATIGRTGISHFFTGSIAEDVVNHSYTPVMTFNLKTIKD